MQKLLEAIAITVEVMGQQISPTAAAMIANDLQAYRQEDVLQALKQVRSGSQRFSLKSVMEQLEKICPDGRPGADEAWAMIPKDEQGSVVMSHEMSQAYGIALPLINDGDMIGARMAFKDSYNRIVEQNKQDGIKVGWFPSLGRDPAMRETVLREAVKLGRLGAEQVSNILPLEDLSPVLAIENKSEISPEKRQENILRLKQILGQSRLTA